VTPGTLLVRLCITIASQPAITLTATLLRRNSRGCSRARNVPNFAEDGGGAWQEAALYLFLPVASQVLHFPRLRRKMLYGWWRERERGEMEAGGLAIPVRVISPKHPTSHLPCCHIGNPSRRWFSSASLLAYLLELNLRRGFCSNLKNVDEIPPV
jgi:hypothetical protein